MVDTFLQGETVGRYELITRLSIGGMAELFLARLAGPGGFQKLVALKMILPDVRLDERFVAMFLDEARLSAELNHPNLGQVFDLGQEKSGELYLAMEFISGQNLGAVLRALQRARRRLPLEVTARVVRDVCLGLHAAHSHVDGSGRPRPVIHRDIAPKNVMVTFDGHVKVIDFGIAHASGRRARTQTGIVKGTPSYMAPEQLAGEAPSPATDVYAVGVMLYECLTGELPYRSDAPYARFVKPPPKPSSKNPQVPVTLDAVCLKALEAEPGRRFQTAREFGRAVADAVSEISDEEGLASLMAELFPGQRASLAKLADTARDPNQPSEQLSRLAREVLVAEATPAEASASSATPLLGVKGGVTQPELEPVATRKLSPRQLVLAGAGSALVLVALTAGLFVLDAEPKREQRAQPIFVPKPAAQAVVTAPGPAPAPVREPTAIVSTDVLATRLEQAFAEGNLLEAETLVNRCRNATPPCPRWPQQLARLQKEQEFSRLLDDAEAAAAANDLNRASMLLAKVQGTTSLQGRARAVEDRVRARTLALIGGVPQARPTEEKNPAVARLLEEGKQAKKDKRYGVAISKLRSCLALEPANADCIVSLASAHAQKGSEENTNTDNEAAKLYYQQFLKVCAPDDKRIPRVKEILMQQ